MLPMVLRNELNFLNHFTLESYAESNIKIVKGRKSVI